MFTFTDPFEIFNSFFGRTSPLHGPFSFGPPRTFPDSFLAPAGFPFQSDPFGPPRPFNPGVGMGGGVFFGGHDLFMPPTMGGAIFQPQGIGNGGPSASHFSSTSSSYSSRQGAGGGQWVSDSRSTSTINGLTTSVHERIDSSVCFFFSLCYSTTNPRLPRVTYIQQPLTQMVIKHTQSTGSPKPQGTLRLLTDVTQTPRNTLVNVITTITTMITHEADTAAITPTKFMTKVRGKPIRIAFPNVISPKIIPLIIVIHAVPAPDTFHPESTVLSILRTTSIFL